MGLDRLGRSRHGVAPPNEMAAVLGVLVVGCDKQLVWVR